MHSKTFNLYCDESCHLENDHKPYMLLGYLSAPYNHIETLKKYFYELKKDHNIKAEIKWSGIFVPKEKFYNDLIDLFFSSDLRFRALIVEKAAIKKEKYGGNDFDEFYYRMYWQLLYHKINTEYAYNIFLDIKDTLSATKVNKLREILKVNYSGIRTLQNIRSHESIFMQLADFLMGAISYKLNVADEHKTGKLSHTKNKLINRIEKNCGGPLHISTRKTEEKFNRFFIDLK